MNTYAAFLKSKPLLLWSARLGLLGLVVVHIVLAVQLSLANKAARPVAYTSGPAYKASYASRTMLMSGLIVAAFIVYHLLHFTLGAVDPRYLHLKDGAGRHDVHAMVIMGFSKPLVSAFYIFAMALLCLHLSHGVNSMFQSVGWSSRCCPNAGRWLANITAWVIFLGNSSIPAAILLGTGSEMKLDAKIPSGPLTQQWARHKFECKLVNPANKRKFEVIVVGSGLAGASASATLGELGYRVKCFCFQDSPRRAHSIAAQGGINASKNYQNDGDSVYRLFYDTIKGGDFRARESNVYRLAEVSESIIDQCVAQGVPFAREYGGLLANRSFGGAQVSRTFYARGQTGQQLLLGAYQALCRQIAAGSVLMFPRTEMLDVVIVDGHAKGIVVRDLVSGAVSSHAGDAVVLATGGYSNVFFLSTNAKGCNVTATYRAYKKGAAFANPCFTQIHPTCIPVSGDHQSKLTLMSESLRNDGRVWVPKQKSDARKPEAIPEQDRDYFLERKYPSFGNLAPRDLASRAAKEVCDEGRGVGPGSLGVYLDFADAIKRLGEETIRERYENLFEMYERITGENAYQRPMRIYPALHYTMGGTWVDYNLMSTVPGLFVIGEANFSDHGANRLGASALMQGLADGYFVLPYTLGHYFAGLKAARPSPSRPEFRRAEEAVAALTSRLLGVGGRRSVTSFHRELGKLLWNHCGMARNEAGLKLALQRIPALREEFWKDVKVTGEHGSLNQDLEAAGRVADYMEFAELLCLDALTRNESCGGHFRTEFQAPDGEALRDDQTCAHVAAWEYSGEGSAPILHKEPLVYTEVAMTQRSYK